MKKSVAFICSFFLLWIFLSLLLLSNFYKFFFFPELLSLYFKFLGQCLFLTFFSKTITHPLSGIATCVPPSKCFAVPTAPYKCMIIDKYIFFISALNSGLLVRLQCCVEFKVIFFFIYDQLWCLKFAWSSIVFFCNFVHSSWLVQIRLLLYAFVYLFCQCR